MAEVLGGSAVEAAPWLLGATIAATLDGETVTVRIVEVEAYAGAGQDPASHAHRGPTRRNAAMFGPAGHAYVYFTYGMHWCLNVVTGPAGEGSAVLLRAGEVMEGRDVARRRRASSRGRVPADRDLARGPARLTEALGVSAVHDGVDLLASDAALRLVLPPTTPAGVVTGPRVGVRQATERPWRFWLANEPTVSAYRSGGRRRRS